MKRLYEAVGLQGHYTNHSLRATAATRIFEAGVDKQLIIKGTGHSTTAGVRSYKRIGEKLTSDVLNSAKRSKLRKLPTQIRANVSPNAAVWVKTSFWSVNHIAAMVGTNFQLLICLVPPTSPSISTSART